MVFFVRPTKGLSPNIPGPRKLPANCIYYTVGLYQWVRVPFGLSNVPAEFQRYMENCLTDVRDKFACPYLDNVLVYSDDFDSYVDHLLKLFQILRENGIKVKAKNCKLFQKQINYLSRTITDKGYATDATNI